MKSYPIKIFTAVYIIILAINFFWFIGHPPSESESPFRFVLGSLLIFLLPGLVWGEVLGFRSNHFLETVALSFAITLVFEIILLPVPFIFDTSIRLWVSLLLLVSVTGVVILLLKTKGGKDSEFISPLWNFARQIYPFNISAPLIMMVIALLSYGAYRWGESITAIDGEKLIHLTFIRYYYSMPMALKDLSVTPGAAPQNLVQLWEYLIAGWASLINVDPLVLFYRARFVIPLLGFSCMYLLIKNIFADRFKSEVIIWGVLIMCLGWFGILSPSNLDWVKEDPLRGIMSFMGTAHHADSAMEILIPLNAGLVLMAFRRSGWRSSLLTAGVLVATFMWHTREFFQAAIYFGIFGLTLLIVPNIDRKRILKMWGIIAIIFIVIALCFFATIVFILPKVPHAYDEFKLKEVALSYAIQNITDIRSLFHFPVDLRLTHGLQKDTLVTNLQLTGLFKGSWNFFLWLIISAIAIPLVAFRGSGEDKHLSLFYILLWFMTLCWGFSQLLLIVFTYSEINFTTPRMIYLFSYIVIATAFYLIFQLMSEKFSSQKSLIISLVVILAAGLIIRLWWSEGLPLSKGFSTLMGILFIVVFFSLLYPKAYGNYSYKTPGFFTTILGIFIFFVPILAKDYSSVISKVFTQSRQSVGWFSDNNPFGLSTDLLQFIKSVPQKQTFLVNPMGNACISVYVPQYTAIPPETMGVTLLGLHDTYNEIQQGKHPLFVLYKLPEVNAGSITKEPDFKSNFKDWRGPDSIKNDIARAAPPLVLHSYKGDFIFKHLSDKESDAIRVSLSPDNKIGSPFISFGYALNDNGFNLKILPEQDVVFTVTARLSDERGKPVQLFITDIANSTIDTSNIVVDKTSWKQYTVNKKVRNGATALFFGIQWQPETSKQWIEIKDARVCVADSIARYYRLPDNYVPDIVINHEAVKAWLDKYAVDYLLIQKDYYSVLTPYFQHHAKDYKIVFNNREHGELIVCYQPKSL